MEPHIGAVVEEVGGDGMAEDPTFPVIIWKQFHLLPLLLIFAFDLNTYTQPTTKQVRFTQQPLLYSLTHFIVYLKGTMQIVNEHIAQ